MIGCFKRRIKLKFISVCRGLKCNCTVSVFNDVLVFTFFCFNCLQYLRMFVIGFYGDVYDMSIVFQTDSS